MASIRISDSVSLLIIGIMFGSITGAVVNILQYFSDPEQLQSFIVWTFGSLGGVTWNEMHLMAPVGKLVNEVALGDHQVDRHLNFELFHQLVDTGANLLPLFAQLCLVDA